MVYTKEWQISKKFCALAELWACAYQPNARRRTALYYTRPVYGVLLAGKTKTAHKEALLVHDYTPRAFAPYSKTGNILYSKAVSINTRIYADTKQEAIALFNRNVNIEIRTLQQKLDQAKSELLDVTPQPDYTPIEHTVDGMPVLVACEYTVFQRRIEPFLAVKPFKARQQLDMGTLYLIEWKPGEPIQIVDNAKPVTLQSGEPAIWFRIQDPENQNKTVDYAVPMEAVDGIPGFAVWGRWEGQSPK